MNINKCYNLFMKTTRIGMEQLKISTFVVLMFLSVLTLREKVQAKISRIPFIVNNLVLILVYFILLIILFASLYCVLKSVMEKEFVLLKTIGFNKSEFYILNLFRINYTLYFYMILFMLIIKTDYVGIRLHIFFIFIISILSYLLIYTVAFLFNYWNILTENCSKKYFIKHYFVVKINDRYYKNHKSLFWSRIKLDLALRCKIKSICILKFILCILAIFMTHAMKSAIICTVINTVFILFITISSDVFWNCERQNAVVYRYMGLSFNKYIFIKIASNFIFSADVLLIITFIATWNLSYLFLTALITVLISMYWSIILSYIFYNKSFEGLYDFIIIGYVILMFIPGISFIGAVKAYKKCLLLWNGEESYALD